MDTTILKTLADYIFLSNMARKDNDYKEELDALAEKLIDEVKALLIIGTNLEQKVEGDAYSDKRMLATINRLLDKPNLTYHIDCVDSAPVSLHAITKPRASSDIMSIKDMQDTLKRKGKVI